MQKKTLPIIIIAVALLIAASTLYSSQNNGSDLPAGKAGESLYPQYSLNMTQEALAARFDHLSQQETNACGGGKDYVAWLSSDGKRIQGSCCSAMILHSYEEQIEGLSARGGSALGGKKYSDYEIIPPDPYDVPAAWADEMMEYAEQTKLTPEQQAVYDQAVEMSHEGGPCCCVCWHWYAYEGLAKHLIINENFSAEQIAEIWNLSDACGGEHAHH